MKIKEQIAHLKRFDLPMKDFIVVSSGAMAIRGIREAKDLDIIVAPELWDEMSKSHKTTVNEWGIERICLTDDIAVLHPAQSIFGNSTIIPREELFSKAEIFEGIKFMDLEHLKKIKLKMGREIDLQDIRLIDEYLKS